MDGGALRRDIVRYNLWESIGGSEMDGFLRFDLLFFWEWVLVVGYLVWLLTRRWLETWLLSHPLHYLRAGDALLTAQCVEGDLVNSYNINYFSGFSSFWKAGRYCFQTTTFDLPLQ